MSLLEVPVVRARRSTISGREWTIAGVQGGLRRDGHGGDGHGGDGYARTGTILLPYGGDAGILPRGKRSIYIHVALDPTDDACCAEICQAFIELYAELAELLVAAVAEREDSVTQRIEAGAVLGQQGVAKGAAILGSLTVAVGACEDHGAALAGEGCHVCFCQRSKDRTMTVSLEILGKLLRKPLRRAAFWVAK